MFKEALYNADRYLYTMCEVAYKKGNDRKPAVFDLFFRKAPDGNNWAVVAGVKQVLNLIRIMNSDEFSYEEKKNIFSKLSKDGQYVRMLCTLKFTGNIYGMRDGEIVFANETILRIEAPYLEGQIIETAFLSIINHAMAIATKASRVFRAARGIPVSAFGSRRAHGPWAAIYGDEAAYIGGCTNVSNIMADVMCGVPSVGTMAHSFVESYGVGKEAEYQAFYDFAEVHSERPVIFLVDTYSVEKSGVPNAIKVSKEFDLEKRFLEKGIPYGIRLDSGDLAYLSKHGRKALDDAGLTHAIIMATNGLDEYLIENLWSQGAKIDGYGVGDAIATSKHNPCFGGVYKLAVIDDQPVMKLSEDTIKVINPGKKNVYRIYQNGEAKADIITLVNDPINKVLNNFEEITIRSEFDRFKTTTFNKAEYVVRNLLTKFVSGGYIKGVTINIDDPDYAKKARKYFLENLQTFSPEHTRIINPHSYKVDISDNLYDLKMKTIEEIRGSMK